MRATAKKQSITLKVFSFSSSTSLCFRVSLTPGDARGRPSVQEQDEGGSKSTRPSGKRQERGRRKNRCSFFAAATAREAKSSGNDFYFGLDLLAHKKFAIQTLSDAATNDDAARPARLFLFSRCSPPQREHGEHIGEVGDEHSCEFLASAAAAEPTPTRRSRCCCRHLNLALSSPPVSPPALPPLRLSCSRSSCAAWPLSPSCREEDIHLLRRHDQRGTREKMGTGEREKKRCKRKLIWLARTKPRLSFFPSYLLHLLHTSSVSYAPFLPLTHLLQIHHPVPCPCPGRLPRQLVRPLQTHGRKRQGEPGCFFSSSKVF